MAVEWTEFWKIRGNIQKGIFPESQEDEGNLILLL